jgi:hypothetical protein
MNAVEKKRHAKFLAVIALAKKHPEKMQKAPAFARLMQKVEADLAPVAGLHEQTEQSTKGLTLEKNQTYDALVRFGDWPRFRYRKSVFGIRLDRLAR